MFNIHLCFKATYRKLLKQSASIFIYLFVNFGILHEEIIKKSLVTDYSYIDLFVPILYSEKAQYNNSALKNNTSQVNK